MNKEEALEFIAQSVKSDVDMAKVADAIKAIEQDPNIRNCFGCKYSKDNHNQAIEECHLCMWENQYTPTTKNDSLYCQHTDEEIAKSFIEDVEAVKDQLPCGEQMDFPSTFDEFAKDYGFKDKKEIYTNGSELIPVFRVKQWLEHISTTKNDLGVDCISRKAAEDITWQDPSYTDPLNILTEVRDKIRELPSVTPQEPFINKPCVSSGVCEHDKNKVLDKLRAEIETKYGQCDICEYFEDYDYEENDISEYRPIGNIADILQIIDKYKEESEET